ncbi:MAG: tetratricopeptide repeat protein [Thermodesulfobacteriota bacterium]
MIFHQKLRTFNLILLALVISVTFFSATTCFSMDATATDPDLKQAIRDYRAEDYEEAALLLEAIRKRDPSSSIAAYYLGLSYKQMMDFEQAAANLRAATKLKPRVNDAVFDLAEMYYKLGKLDECLTQLEEAKRLGIQPAHTTFLKGTVMAKKGRHKEAIKLFSEAKALNPSLTQSADYKTGLSLVKMGSLKEAGKAFNDLIIEDPNSDLANFARQQVEVMKRIKQQNQQSKPIRLAASVGYEYDDNALLQPSDQTATKIITGTHDYRRVFTFRGEYIPKLSGPLRFKAQYSLFDSDHRDLHALDVSSHTVALVPSYRIKGNSFISGSTLNMLLSYNYTWVDNDKYLYTYTVSPGYTFIFPKGFMGQVGARFQKKEFVKSPMLAVEDRDANQYAAYISAFYLFMKNKGLANTKYEISRETTDGHNWSYIGHRVSANLSFPLIMNFRATGSADAFYHRFDNKHTTFFKSREDMTWTLASSLSYDFYKNADLQVKYAYTRGESNIPVYDYHKFVAGLSLNVKY